MNMEKSLKMLKEWRANAIELDYSIAWKIGHALAEAKYLPARDFFVLCLGDPNWRWREDCISFLGFHFPLDNNILEKIRGILLSDSSSNVRISAAYALGKQSSLPDQALFEALQTDSDHMVRESAYYAILLLAGVSYPTRIREKKSLKNGLVKPEFPEIFRVLKEENIDSPDSWFDKIT